MAANYTSVARVVTLLGWIDENGNRPTPDANTIPTGTEITEMIEDAENEIERYCYTAWREITVTEECHSSPVIYSHRPRYGIYIQMNNRHIRTLSSAAGDKIEVWQGTGYVDLLATGTQGAGPDDGDFYIDYRKGMLWLYTNFPDFYRENTVKLTYRYGQTSIPNAIRRAATLLACAYCIEAGFDWTYTMVDQVTSMSNSEKAMKWEERAFKLAASFRIMLPMAQH